MVNMLCFCAYIQVRLLKSLGIQSVLLTDGSSPVNLFQTAQGFITQK